MRIAVEASTWTNTRGYGRFTRELTLALLRAESTHRFTLVVDSGSAAGLPPGADVVVVPTRRSVVDAATADDSRSPLDMARMAARLSRGFDAVLFPTNFSFVPIWPGRFVAVVIHDAIPEAMPGLVLGSRRARLLWGAKNQLVCRRANLLATVSEASAREIRRLLPVGARELLVLTEGASQVFSAARMPDDERLVRDATGDTGRFVLYVGGFSPHKRVADLVRAFGTVAAAEPFRHLRLVLAGPGDRDTFASDHLGVADAIHAIGDAGHRVVKTGFVPDLTLAALYRMAECVVLPSAIEGFGLPALEAMTSGTPLIATRNPALSEVCGEAAEFVDEIEQLPAVLRRLLDDPARRRALRAAGLQQAGRFSWDESARRLLEAFDRAATR